MTTVTVTPTGAAYRRLALLITTISSLGPFAIDTYLPSFPEIARSFGVPMVAVQQTLTAYMLPFAIMTLWHGAISDTLGRRRVVISGLLLFMAGSALCALAPTLTVLLVGRALQGMSAGAGMVVGRAIIRDVCAGAAAQRLMSLVSLTFAVAPAVAPVVGGWLHVWFGWRSVFVFLTLLTAGIAGWCYLALPETLPREARRRFKPGLLLRGYAMVLSHPAFVAVGATLMLVFGGMFTYILAAPVFLMQHLGLSETEFYWLYAPNTLAMMAGALLSGRLAGRMTRLRTVRWSFRIMLTAALANMLLNLLWPPQVPWSIIPIALYVLGMALGMPSLMLMGLDLFPRRRGLAASCQAFIQSGGATLVSAFWVPLVWSSPLTLAGGMAVLLLGGTAGLGAFLAAMARRETGTGGA